MKNMFEKLQFLLVFLSTLIKHDGRTPKNML